jgi:hypothetical protein
VNALALVLNVISEKLGCQKMWWLGVFIAPNHLVVVGQGCWRWAHQTVRCATEQHCSLSGALPRHPTVRIRSWVDHWSFVFLRHRQSSATPDSPVPSDFAALSSAWHCSLSLFTLQSTVARIESLLCWLIGQSGGTPNSPVNYSGAPWNSREWLVDIYTVLVHQTMSGGTPDSLVRHSSAHSSPFAPI